MDVYEITGYSTGQDNSGVNFLQPSDSFQDVENGFIYRQVLQSRQGFAKFADRLTNGTRVTGIFEHTKVDGTTDLLAFDTNNAYKYNTSTGVFDQLAFGGSMAAYGGFGLSGNDTFISGTSYLDSAGAMRFVFTSTGMTTTAGSGVFFYDGTVIKNYTSVVDNPDYVAPPQGVLAKAKYVVNFGGRLNFLYPTLGGVQFAQAILYSGIQNTAGNGDKYNVSGAGLREGDTYEFITGFARLGNTLLINYNRSAFVVEQTSNVFNPYFIRRLPGVLGTNADFSSVVWNDLVKSIGNTGVLASDQRQSLRCDNKIPFYTEDEFDNIEFNATYGGFDRDYSQFIWSYVKSDSDGTVPNRALVNNYEFDTWATYDYRFTCYGQTDLGVNVPWNEISAVDHPENPSWSRWDTTEEIWNKIGLGLADQKTLAGDNLGFIYRLNQDLDDFDAAVTAITKASQAVLTVGESNFQAGDLVSVENVTGMTEINNVVNGVQVKPYYVVISSTSTSVTLDVNSTDYTTYVDGGLITKVIPFLAKTIPFNPYREQGRQVYISHVELLIDTNGGELNLSVTQNDDNDPFIVDVPMNTYGIEKRREWVTMTVDNEADFMTFILKQTSGNGRIKVTSMRIYARPGAPSYG